MAQVFFFEVTEEILHGSIVPAVGATGHGRSDVILVHKDIIIRLRSVLVALVTVEDESSSDLFSLFGLVHGLGDQTDGIVLSKDAGNDEAIEEIFDGGEIAPALLGQNVGHIGDPLLVRTGRHKVPVEHIGVGVVRSKLLQLLVHFPLSGSGVDAQLVHET